jgi:hypothetical protein
LTANLSPPEIRATLRKVLEPKFHAVVANPPYIGEKDDVRKAYHREKLAHNQQRYISAYMQYSLGGPFIERALQLGVANSFCGFITSNNFTKSEFGRPLVEQVLSRIDLNLVVDTSKAFIPNHETPTILLFACNNPPTKEDVLVVRAKRGETSDRDDPAHGRVWLGIKEGWATPGYEDAYVSTALVGRKVLASHPWVLSGGGVDAVLAMLDGAATQTLGAFVKDIGRTTVCGIDDIFIMSPREATRLRTRRALKRIVTGERVRAWSVRAGDWAIYPYEHFGGDHISESDPIVSSFFWPYRTLLRNRTVFGKSPEDRGGVWFEHLEHYEQRLTRPRSLVFSNVATHNHFAFQREIRLSNAHAPVLNLKDDSEESYLWLLGILNSSSLGFWMREVSQEKGGASTGKKRQSETWARRLEYRTTKLKGAPINSSQRPRIVDLAQRIDKLAEELEHLHPAELLATQWAEDRIESVLQSAQGRSFELRNMMVSLQEELDWTVYTAFGLTSENEIVPMEAIRPLSSEHRPFAIRLARTAGNEEVTSYWFEAMGLQACTQLPATLEPATRETIERRLAQLESNEALSIIESPEYKRKWERIRFAEDLETACFEFLADIVEDALSAFTKPLTLARIVGLVQNNTRFLTVASIYQNRRDVDVMGLVSDIVAAESVPNHPFHTYTDSGLTKRAAWTAVWELQRQEDAGNEVGNVPVPPEFSQGSRGKSTDFLRNSYWRVRGRFDVPTERFVAYTEVLRRGGGETLYGWGGWTSVQRLKALLAVDEELEDAGISLVDRVGVLDSAWRLLPDVAREDPVAATRLKAEIQALVGPQGPSRELIDDWRKRVPPPGKSGQVVASKDDDGEDEKSEELS